MPKFVSRSKLAQPTGQPVTPPVEQPESTNYTLPKTAIELKDLPSQGKSYPPGVVVRYRPYTFGEVKTLSQEHSPAKKNNPKHVFEAVLKGIFVEGLDTGQLTLADVLYLGFLRKISTVGGDEKVNIGVNCPECGTHNTFIFETGNIEFDELPAPKLPINVTLKNKVEYHFKPLTLDQYYQLLKKEKHTDPMAMLAAQCVNQSFEEAYNAFYEADVEDGVVLQKVDEYLYHGLKSVVDNCKKCGTEFSVSLDGGEGLILPFREREESPESRIRFG